MGGWVGGGFGRMESDPFLAEFLRGVFSLEVGGWVGGWVGGLGWVEENETV